MGTVIPLFTENTRPIKSAKQIKNTKQINNVSQFKKAEPIAKPNERPSLRDAIRSMEEALVEQAEVFEEYKNTTEQLYKNIKSIEMNYALFGQALEDAQHNTLRLRKKAARLEAIMNDLQYQNNKRMAMA